MSYSHILVVARLQSRVVYDLVKVLLVDLYFLAQGSLMLHIELAHDLFHAVLLLILKCSYYGLALDSIVDFA
jgi:hypothetical protein